MRAYAYTRGGAGAKVDAGATCGVGAAGEAGEFERDVRFFQRPF